MGRTKFEQLIDEQNVTSQVHAMHTVSVQRDRKRANVIAKRYRCKDNFLQLPNTNRFLFKRRLPANRVKPKEKDFLSLNNENFRKFIQLRN